MRKFKYRVISVALVTISMLSMCGCNIKEFSRPITNGPTEVAPVPRPELAATIYAGENEGVCFPIANNIVVTANHVLPKEDSVSLSVMNYDATIVYRSELRDIAMLKTTWRFEEWYRIADNTDKDYIIGTSYVKGDSGMPLLTRRGNVAAMLIGQRSDGTYAVTEVLHLAEYRELISEYAKKDIISSSSSTSSTS